MDRHSIQQSREEKRYDELLSGLHILANLFKNDFSYAIESSFNDFNLMILLAILSHISWHF